MAKNETKQLELQDGAPVQTPSIPEESQEQENPISEISTEEEVEDPRVLEMQNALAAFPSLAEGYLCKKDVYFDKEIAKSRLEEGEELIIVQRLNKN